MPVKYLLQEVNVYINGKRKGKSIATIKCDIEYEQYEHMKIFCKNIERDYLYNYDKTVECFPTYKEIPDVKIV